MTLEKQFEYIRQATLSGEDVADIPLEVWGVKEVKRRSIVRDGKFYAYDGKEVLAPYYVRFEDDTN